ncbi:MAG: prephenate dehydrogenase [Anaerolineae bacterium]|nr:prephenate dehydrogenase [Anaerolineae bacterium]
MKLAETRVAVVGLGLMGGSLAAALVQRGACAEVVGVARRPETCQQAEAKGFVHRATTDLQAGVAAAGLVILATPVRTILRLLPRLGALLAAGTVVLDVGSTKAAICQAMDALPAGLQPVGGHPMCGKEVHGLDAATPDLYEGAPFVLTPLPRTGAEALALARELARAAGAWPLEMPPDRHDRLVAAVSHLPYVLAVVLARLVARAGQEDAEVWDLAASGFRDTSRLAASDVTMMLDILLTNQAPIRTLLADAAEELGRLAALLEAGDEERLREVLAAAQAARREWKG